MVKILVEERDCWPTKASIVHARATQKNELVSREEPLLKKQTQSVRERRHESKSVAHLYSQAAKSLNVSSSLISVANRGARGARNAKRVEKENEHAERSRVDVRHDAGSAGRAHQHERVQVGVDRRRRGAACRRWRLRRGRAPAVPRAELPARVSRSLSTRSTCSACTRYAARDRQRVVVAAHRAAPAAAAASVVRRRRVRVRPRRPPLAVARSVRLAVVCCSCAFLVPLRAAPPRAARRVCRQTNPFLALSLLSLCWFFVSPSRAACAPAAPPAGSVVRLCFARWQCACLCAHAAARTHALTHFSRCSSLPAEADSDSAGTNGALPTAPGTEGDRDECVCALCFRTCFSAQALAAHLRADHAV